MRKKRAQSFLRRTPASYSYALDAPEWLSDAELDTLVEDAIARWHGRVTLSGLEPVGEPQATVVQYLFPIEVGNDVTLASRQVRVIGQVRGFDPGAGW